MFSGDQTATELFFKACEEGNEKTVTEFVDLDPSIVEATSGKDLKCVFYKHLLIKEDGESNL